MDLNATDAVNDDSLSQPDHKECMKLLQLVLDNEATPQEKNTFEKHVCNCMPYFEIYQMDKTIKSMVKETCCGGDVPTDLANTIKAKLFLKAD